MVGFTPATFSVHSGLWPLASALGGRRVEYPVVWENVARRSWTAGHLLRQWGNRYYGSTWNALVPYISERKIIGTLPQSQDGYPVHFLWGEFGAPKHVEPYHRKGARVIVNVHCSARRWGSVWLRPDGYKHSDMVVLTSESQRPFVEKDVPSERVRVIPLGVDTEWFAPPQRRNARGSKLIMLLLGNTERDHEFAAEVAKRLPSDQFEWRIRTDSRHHSLYEGIGCVELLPRLSDEEFLREYQGGDVLAMPMLDSAANDVLLESMSCGMPVMINRTGGVPEYVRPDCNFIMNNDRNVDGWVDKLLWLERNRDVLEQMRPLTRAWAETFSWSRVAGQYRRLYNELTAV